MSDQINNNNNSQGNIMKELSDIKTSLAVNTTETQFIKISVNEVKADVKEMKSSYVNQDQHKTVTDELAKHDAAIILINKTQEEFKEKLSTNNALFKVGIFLLLTITGMLIYHLFGIKI